MWFCCFVDFFHLSYYSKLIFYNLIIVSTSNKNTPGKLVGNAIESYGKKPMDRDKKQLESLQSLQSQDSSAKEGLLLDF